MAKIKIRQKEKNKTPIKTLDKKLLHKKKLKNNLINIKEKENVNDKEETNSAEYGINKMTEQANMMINKGTNTFNKYGQKSIKETKINIQKATEKIKKKVDTRNIKIYTKDTTKVKSIKPNIKVSTKNEKARIKKAKSNIKTVKQTRKVVYKTTKQTLNTTINTSKKAFQIAKTTAKATLHAIKAGAKATVATVKGIILATKALITALLAGGWVAVVIIILICLIAMLCSSVFGIFFSSENDVGDKTMSDIIREINMEFTNEITKIQNNTKHDDYEINSKRAEWKDILCVYSVFVSNGEEQTDVVTLDEDKIKQLKKIFWEMNIINSKVKEKEVEIETIDDKGNTQIEKVKRKILYINITSRTIEDMIEKYNFNENQIQQLAELQKEEYDSIWTHVVYGSATGSQDIVNVAISQVGNIGGQPYWSWYGYESKVDWCACFVSWCANECGYIEKGIIPKFASCNSEGIAWFKACNLWQEKGYIPKAGDIIFFDWENDNRANHVGIVEKVDNNRVYTIEGNSSDVCKQKDYDINSSLIYGYGTPIYS